MLGWFEITEPLDKDGEGALDGCLDEDLLAHYFISCGGGHGSSLVGSSAMSAYPDNARFQNVSS